MGVKKFRAFLQKHFPNSFNTDIQAIFNSPDGRRFDHVFVDLNDVLHDVLRKANDLDKAYKLIFQKLDQILRVCIPKKSFYIAVDGGAPKSKLLTQRKRRLMSTTKAQKKGIPSNGIHATPGTPFMLQLKDALRFWCTSRLVKGKFYQSVNFFVSASDVPGEGEHKILDRIHYLAQNNEAKNSYAIVSSDADITLMAMGSLVQNIFVYMREPRGMYSSFSIPETVQRLREIFPGRNMHRIRRDLTFLFLMLGNDYLKKLRGASDSALWTRYQWIQLKYFNNNKNNNNFEYLLNEDCSINFKFFLPFLCPFGGNRIFYEPLAWQDSDSDEEPQEQDPNQNENSETPIKKSMSIDSIEDIEGEEIIFQGESSKLPEKESSKENSKKEISDMDEDDELDEDFEDDEEEDDDDEDFDDDEDEEEEDEENLPMEIPEEISTNFQVERSSKKRADAVEYLRGLLWCSHMFFTGQCSDYTFVYKFPKSPSPKDIMEFCVPNIDPSIIKDHNLASSFFGTVNVTDIPLPVSEVLPPIQLKTLLYLLPVSKMELLPLNAQVLMGPTSVLADIYHKQTVSIDTDRIDAALESILESIKESIDPRLLHFQKTLHFFRQPNINSKFVVPTPPSNMEALRGPFFVVEKEIESYNVRKVSEMRFDHYEHSYVYKPFHKATAQRKEGRVGAPYSKQQATEHRFSHQVQAKREADPNSVSPPDNETEAAPQPEAKRGGYRGRGSDNRGRGGDRGVYRGGFRGANRDGRGGSPGNNNRGRGRGGHNNNNNTTFVPKQDVNQ